MESSKIGHFDEARQSVLEELRRLQREGRVQKAVLMPDIFARVRVVGWLPPSAEPRQVEGRLQASAGPFWGGLWVAPGQTPADKEMLDSIWDESQPLEEGIRLNERYRFMGIWLGLPPEPPWETDDTAEDYGSPIVTFYSFRGGVGRTTALVAFALQRAHKGERVVVVDLDLEAPGVSALLEPNPESPPPGRGVVDYLLEQPLLGKVTLGDYSYPADHRLTGGGTVHVVPAGRIDENYAGKLARVDFNPPSPGSKHPLQSLLFQIREEFKPHWILLDSRTGLSESAGFALGGFAHLNVIFGTASEQSWQGLRYAIRRLGVDRVRRDLPQAECILVQGMVPENPEIARVSEEMFRTRAEEEFKSLYYAEDPEDPEEDRMWYIRDMQEGDAPHVPVPLYYTPRLAFFTKLDSVVETMLTSPDYRNLSARIASRIHREETMEEIEWHKRQELLTGLADIVGTPYAEREHQFTRMFYPVPEHAKIFDPDIVLIVGGHGTGKSTWFKAVVEENLMPQIARWIPSGRLPLASTEKISWLAGYPLGTAFADPIHLSRFVKNWADEEEALHAVSDVWFAYLIRVLKDTLKPFLSSDHYPLFAVEGGDVDAIYQAFQHSRMSFLVAMDKLEQALQDTDRWVFMNYDELETIAGVDWAATNLLIRGLLAFWATYDRRWTRIRAKIFLRSDLFRRIRVGVADFTKLVGYRLELTWSPRSLYAMLVKRLLNASDALRDYTLKTEGLRIGRDEILGLIPIFESWEAARPLIERLAGPYMGANIKKGRTFTWILDHLADGKGIVTPRALVDLIRQSAREELEFSRAKGGQLLHPTSIRRALDRVSEEYMKTLQDRELPWLKGVSERIRGTVVPIGRDEVEKMLATNWEHWESESNIRPPVDTPRELVNVLVELGVFRQRFDGRIDVPDLFLAGLGLKRKGGVRRR